MDSVGAARWLGPDVVGMHLSLFETLARWMRSPSSGRRPPLFLELRARGAGREVIRFVEPYGTDLAQAWLECGRGSWCVEIAACVGVASGLIERAVGDLAEASGGDAEEASEEARAAVRAFAAQQCDTEQLAAAVGDLCAVIVEAQPDVRAALAQIEGVARPDFAAYDAYDQIYADAHRRLADVVRRRISGAEVRVALEGLESHPYR